MIVHWPSFLLGMAVPFGAVAAVGGTDEGTFFGRLIDPTLLIEGANVLAVEVHQVSMVSSDRILCVTSCSKALKDLFIDNCKI